MRNPTTEHDVCGETGKTVARSVQHSLEEERVYVSSVLVVEWKH